jgi:hypothetical protein
MGIASIDFPSGPSLKFRLDPEDIAWSFKILTNVTNTMGGRVIQVIGATLSDLTIKGSVGEQRGKTHLTSWQLAEGFYAKVANLMDHQSKGSDGRVLMVDPGTFTYAPLDIRLKCYIKGIADADGQSGISHRQGKFSYGYALTLFIVPEGSGRLRVAGSDTNGYVDAKRAQAIENAMKRIANGIGWHYSEQYNGFALNSGIGGTEVGSVSYTNGGQVPVKTVVVGGVGG